MARSEAPDSVGTGAGRGRSPDTGRSAGHRAWFADRPLLLELFVAVNLAFLVADTWLAHEANDFAHAAEYVAPIFSAIGAAALAAALVGVLRRRGGGAPAGGLRLVGSLVGSAAILVGVAGMILHLEGQFFQETTLRSLVYSAPFAAPLSFTGIGFLLLLNRMVDPDGERWAGWILVLTLGGFVGNFALALADHAQNGFFYVTEWIPVAAAAVAVGYLATLFLRSVNRAFLRAGFWVMGFEAVVGIAGLALHAEPLLHAPREGLAAKVLYGAPIFAPLLFPNLALLGALGLWDLSAKRAAGHGDRARE